MIKTFDETVLLLQSLKPDCAKCSGLCCTALFFSKLDGFPEDKSAGTPCTNLQQDFRCQIHSELDQRKLKGCIGYDCFGAGQHVTQIIYAKETWRSMPKQAKEIFDVFLFVFQLYQIRYFLLESLIVSPAALLKNKIKTLLEENERICRSQPSEILAFEMEDYRDRANVVLKQVCTLLQESLSHKNKAYPSDFLGRNFANQDMSGLDLSTKLLIAAKFNHCNFDGTIFIGADMRDADLSDADLRNAVFLTQGQINSAKGDKTTKLPSYLDQPITWK